MTRARPKTRIEEISSPRLRRSASSSPGAIAPGRPLELHVSVEAHAIAVAIVVPVVLSLLRERRARPSSRYPGPSMRRDRDCFMTSTTSLRAKAKCMPTSTARRCVGLRDSTPDPDDTLMRPAWLGRCGSGSLVAGADRTTAMPANTSADATSVRLENGSDSKQRAEDNGNERIHVRVQGDGRRRGDTSTRTRTRRTRRPIRRGQIDQDALSDRARERQPAPFAGDGPDHERTSRRRPASASPTSRAATPTRCCASCTPCRPPSPRHATCNASTPAMNQMPSSSAGEQLRPDQHDDAGEADGQAEQRSRRSGRSPPFAGRLDQHVPERHDRHDDRGETAGHVLLRPHDAAIAEHHHQERGDRNRAPRHAAVAAPVP